VRRGSFGVLASETATPLAMVITEALQNAVEHGYPDPASAREGTIELEAVTAPGRLVVTISDDGRGLPEGFDLAASTSLGLSIVRTLVESELGGTLEMGPAAGGGTRVRIELPA